MFVVQKSIKWISKGNYLSWKIEGFVEYELFLLTSKATKDKGYFQE